MAVEVVVAVVTVKKISNEIISLFTWNVRFFFHEWDNEKFHDVLEGVRCSCSWREHSLMFTESFARIHEKYYFFFPVSAV